MAIHPHTTAILASALCSADAAQELVAAIDAGGGGAVSSVAGRTGDVTLTHSDISGLGTLATQSGTFSGTSSGTNTGDQTVGTIATQNSNNVTITGGTINGTTVGATTPAAIRGYRPSNVQTGTTYTFALTDDGKLVTGANGGGITWTVPKNATIAFPVDAEIDLAQLGDGQITLQPEDGTVTINSYQGKLALVGKFAGATLKQTAANVWLLVGALA